MYKLDGIASQILCTSYNLNREILEVQILDALDVFVAIVH